MTILSIRGAPVSSGQVQKTVRLRGSRVILIVRRKTSVVCIRGVPCVMSNVPAEARARLQRCSRLTSPMIRLLRGICQHPSPLMSRGGLSLWLLQLAPSTPRPGLHRRVTKQPVIAGGSSRFAGIPPDVPAEVVGRGVLSTPEKGLSHNRMDGAKVGPQRGQILASP